ncbi:nucleotidyltransferase family protein [Noviherbaspirillum denitrificans]|uniref:Nucleotidyltransferase n=1 Tax=Noviherbaspirillum denitrificans TaxID=1968433 RepID=A0A254TGS4_9BURK|nr:nucleotidyltransferase domain-containing protein [Noviherbaspirillum denitrificans]OWW21856.1 nucleotidyltransferase [Noviherbaspirillum denitrificans]
MKPSVALQSHCHVIRRIVELHRDRNVRAFGSGIHGNDTDGSDLDLLVDSTPDTALMDVAAIQVEQEELLGVTVDVLTPKTSPEKFRGAVLADRVHV